MLGGHWLCRVGTDGEEVLDFIPGIHLAVLGASPGSAVRAVSHSGREAGYGGLVMTTLWLIKLLTPLIVRVILILGLFTTWEVEMTNGTF